MRILIIFTAIFLQASSYVLASTNNTNNNENINLNIKDHELAVTFLGLSDGEVTLLQGPNDENILVNTGGEGTWDELQKWLEIFGVKELQAIIITNQDQLISENIKGVVTAFNPEKLISTSEINSELEKIFTDEIHVEQINWNEGIETNILPEVTAKVLFSGNGENEGLDFTLHFFQHRIFLMTSFSPRAEEVFLKTDLNDIHIFKIPNWAKEDSLSETLIQYLNPHVSILFESEKIQPDPDILSDLQDTWSDILFTKKHGTISIKFTESSYEVFTINEKAINEVD